jgi:2-amino-4-hydroxy-6-hydroxymethyldihydropteridine diphosphokinase
LGDREAYLRGALVPLAALPGIALSRVSSVYETAPVGVINQPAFLNLVVELQTTLSARELLAACQAIENAAGRVRERRWGPRTLDLDLLFYGEETRDDPDLQLPHPRLLERQFVLAPLAEVAPDLLLPDGRRAAEAADFGDPGLTRVGPPPPFPGPSTF